MSAVIEEYSYINTLFRVKVFLDFILLQVLHSKETAEVLLGKPF